MQYAVPRCQVLQRLTWPHACCGSCSYRTQRSLAVSAGGRQPAELSKLQKRNLCSSVCWLHGQLDSLGASYMFTGATAAWLQGADIQFQQLNPLQVSIQWDFMNDLHRQLSQPQTPSHQSSGTSSAESKQHAGMQQQDPVQVHSTGIVRRPGGVLSFTTAIYNNMILVTCELNRVLHMSPNRLPITRNGNRLWCESLLSVRDRSSNTDPLLSELVDKRLQQLQAELTAANGVVWGQAETADAWGTKVGSPTEAATWLQQDPLLRLGASIHKHLPQQLAGSKVINLMGSNGTKAVAAALLGAQVTCVDISPANVQYGQQLAEAAGVDVELVVADVLALPDNIMEGGYDIVLLELGVLHYFIDLQPLMQVIHRLLQPGGLLLLREFHPISTKLITSKGKKHKVTGDYFSQQLVPTQVAYSKYAAVAGAQEATGGGMTVQLRQWALGEVVTSVSEAGLILRRLEEEPGVKSADAGLPKLYTLVATKPT